MVQNKKAFITGITGQDGAILAKKLLDMDYQVVGTSRDSSICNKSNLENLGIISKINLLSMNLSDYRSVINVLKEVRPDQIYNLGGLTSVGLSFQQPIEAIESISYGVLNILEAVRLLEFDCIIFNAGSTECFGNINLDQQPANEETAFNPRSPYAIAKSTAFWYVKNYRETYGIKAFTGIMSNHESPLRPKRFVIKKITDEAFQISKGLSKKITLGNIDIERDWGWAEDYIDGVLKIIHSDIIDDFVIATGITISLREMATKIFKYFDLDFEKYLLIDESLYRPYEIPRSALNPEKIYKKISWKARLNSDQIVENLCKSATK